jgi:hypothetical protein
MGEQRQGLVYGIMFYISKTRPAGRKLVPFLESAGQIYPETVLTFEATNYVLASVIVWIWRTSGRPEHLRIRMLHNEVIG